jgi:hypothetical protein
MAIDTLKTDSPMADDLRLDDLRLHRLGVNDLEAASWGASWQPEDRTRTDWLDVDDQQRRDEEALISSDAWDFWPVLERLGESRRRLLGP